MILNLRPILTNFKINNEIINHQQQQQQHKNSTKPRRDDPILPPYSISTEVASEPFRSAGKHQKSKLYSLQ